MMEHILRKVLHYKITMFTYIHSFIHSIGMCRMWQFLAVLRNFFHSPLLYTLSFHPFPPTSLHPPSFHLAICFLVYLSALLFPNSFIIHFWEFYFFPFSVHAQTNIIYLTLLPLIVGFLTIAYISLLVNILQFSF